MFNQFPGYHQQMQPPRGPAFFKELRVYPASFAFRQDIETGDKILLPASCLGELYNMIHGRNKDPMVFCIKSDLKHTFCGVLEFVAEQGLCYIPGWMFKQLKFGEPGTPGTVTLVTDMKKKNVKTAYFIKLRPHLTKFIELDNPKAVLQYQLRNFTCLHQGDTIQISTFSGKFDIDILEIKPSNDYNAICIIDTDVQVDFAPPLDYQQPSQPNNNVGHFVENNQSNKNGPFGGNGIRIDQKQSNPGRKISQQIQQEQYDPRKHRIHRGVRKLTVDWTGNGVKIGVPQGTKKK